MTNTDPIALTQSLIRCPSVTPADEGALDVLVSLLEPAGFACVRVDRGGICNLFARWGEKGHAKSFGFNGHTDVVPIGAREDWSVDPFGAEIRDDILYGRGATDMKSGVAAFAAAAIDFVTQTPPDGAVILTITGDEEGAGIDGTRALLDYMSDQSETMSACLVGEPTCPDQIGDMMKIGRRGSMTAYVTVEGVQGHSAYPHRAKNPMPAMAELMHLWASHQLDQGSDHFDASTLAVVTIDTGNPANNVIPATTRSTVNIRFNDLHSSASLSDWLRSTASEVATRHGVEISLEMKVSGESFVTPPGALSDLIAEAVTQETGLTPVLSTTGGTSDARFVKDHCPVVEFGLVGKTMHQVDECVPVDQIHTLKAIYGRILRDYFG